MRRGSAGERRIFTAVVKGKLQALEYICAKRAPQTSRAAKRKDVGFFGRPAAMACDASSRDNRCCYGDNNSMDVRNVGGRLSGIDRGLSGETPIARQITRTGEG